MKFPIKKVKIGLCILLLFSILFISCNNVSPESIPTNTTNAQAITADNVTKQSIDYSIPAKQSILSNANEQAPNTPKQNTGELIVSFLDVGQADCTLITFGDDTLLIDAGDIANGNKIVAYMQEKNINDIDYFITTHPHADHIGGAIAVLDAYDIDTLLMPNASHTTNTYQNFIQRVSENDCKKILPNQHDLYTLGDASFEILSTNQFPYGSNINNASIVIKLNYKDNSFLFMGDAEAPLENALIQGIGADLKADVIKIGHHGSSSSSTENFMQYVSPEIAVISVGKNNQYGHPAQQVLNLLMAMNTTIYRTDIVGTITLTSDGEEITVNTHNDTQNINSNPGTINTQNDSPIAETAPKIENSTPENETKEITVYITKTGTKYHSNGCRYLSKSQIPISLENAKSNGYEPCKVCKPAA